jgi:transcriptional regulator with XRE-family HTH domain
MPMPDPDNQPTDDDLMSQQHSVEALEIAIGKQVRTSRKRLNLTVAALAKQAQLSTGMLSKIENGQTSPSLATLTSLANALQVPVTSFFRGYEEQRDVTYIKAGEGLPIERRGSGAGHQYQLLGHTIGKPYNIEPYLITIDDQSEVFPVFQHAGTELIYMLEGRVTYRHANKTYTLEPGDTLFFDAEASHGPDEIQKLPCRYLSIIISEATSV